MRSIVDVFDPDNIDHIRAYKVVMDTGMWPKGFIPDDVILGRAWAIFLADKIAERWVAHMLSGENV